jgi:hypothetical protein
MTIRKYLFKKLKKFHHPHERASRRIIMCGTATLDTTMHSDGEGGGSLGVFVHFFSLEGGI